ncbi:hypothetical protein RJT34_07330 [Clitoria ternatea]|uniref:FAS1 domain-containing protein n=1 Tax=Clitoria ternatea TaxID=43366 RepID=A0AAN9PUT3_CLITE
MSSILLTLSLLLLFSSPSLSLPSSTVLDAAEILSTTAGFDTMALHLELVSQTLQSRSLTIFAPTNLAFKQISHLPLSLLRYHILPRAFSLHSLTSLPFGASIPTLLPNHSLTVTTTTPRHLSINNVTVNPSPIFTHPYLVIFPTHTFFDPNFHLPPKTPPNTPCFPANFNSSSHKVTRVLRSRGYSAMALVLDMQFPGLDDGNRRQLTLLAPVDEAIANRTDLPAIIRRHLLPCRMTWSDLVALEDGTLIGTYERGISLRVTKPSSDTVLLNGVSVIFPDLYHSDWLVVHGLQGVLKGRRHRKTPQDSDEMTVEAEDAEQSTSLEGVENSEQHLHFSVFH